MSGLCLPAMLLSYFVLNLFVLLSKPRFPNLVIPEVCTRSFCLGGRVVFLYIVVCLPISLLSIN